MNNRNAFCRTVLVLLMTFSTMSDVYCAAFAHTNIHLVDLLQQMRVEAKNVID